MTKLSIISAPDPSSSPAAFERAMTRHLQQADTEVYDAVLVDWPTPDPAPRLRRVYNLACLHPLGPSFWELLAAASFRLPLADTPAAAALATTIGLPTDLTQKLRHIMLPGTQAIMIVSDSTFTQPGGPTQFNVLVEENLELENGRPLWTAFAP